MKNLGNYGKGSYRWPHFWSSDNSAESLETSKLKPVYKEDAAFLGVLDILSPLSILACQLRSPENKDPTKDFSYPITSPKALKSG